MSSIQLPYYRELITHYKIRILINADVNLMHAILQHCYFKAPLFHYKTLLVLDSSIGSSESLSDRMSSFNIELKMSFD